MAEIYPSRLSNLLKTYTESPAEPQALNFILQFGIFVDKNLEIGGLFGYTSSSQEYTSTTNSGRESGSDGFTAGLYENKYFQITENFLFSLLGNVKYRYSKSFSKGHPSNLPNNQNNEDSRENKNIQAEFAPNLIFFPSPNWALTADLGGVWYSYTIKPEDSKSHTFGVSLGQSFSFGLSYYFRK